MSASTTQQRDRLPAEQQSKRDERDPCRNPEHEPLRNRLVAVRVRAAAGVLTGERDRTPTETEPDPERKSGIEIR